MKYFSKEMRFKDFYNKWETQFKKIPHILNYISSYPVISSKLQDSFQQNIKELTDSQFEWVSLVAQFVNPIETSFFKDFWVPVQKEGYDYFIDLSSDSLPLFETNYFFFEPYRWYKKYIFKDLSQFLINIDNSKFSIEKHFKQLDDERWLEVNDLFNEKDTLGFASRLELDPLKINRISCEGQNSYYIIEDKHITFLGVNSVIVGLIPLQYNITLENFNAPYNRNKNVIDKVKNIKSLVYLLLSVGFLNINSFSIKFESVKECRAIFKNNTFMIEHTDKAFLNSLIDNFEIYKNI